MRFILVFSHEVETPITVEADTREEAIEKAWANEGEPGQESYSEQYIKEIRAED
jgi:hypothetical protein